MPQARDEVRLRTTGLTELADETLVRFGTTEPHAVVKAALAGADLYGPVLRPLGLPPQAVLAVSCFAATDEWPPGGWLTAATRSTSTWWSSAAWAWVSCRREPGRRRNAGRCGNASCQRSVGCWMPWTARTPSLAAAERYTSGTEASDEDDHPHRRHR